MLWYLHLTKKDTLLIKSKYSVFFSKAVSRIFPRFQTRAEF